MKNYLYCNDVSEKHLGKEIQINGWVKKNRKLGSLIFMDIYDRTGIVQAIINDKHQQFDFALSITKESVVSIVGRVVKRTNPNNELSTGLYEIEIANIVLHSKALTPPFLIQENTDGLEDIRLKYRYLDLRRPNIQKNIIFRSKLIHALRTFLIENNFIEIETPILSKQTPEGARDYIVPTRSKKFYALPQSPQIYKQLLMVSGFLRYFQVAKCFRDEDLRADRQPEFTQLDIETSFLKQEDIMTLIENLMVYVFKNVMNINLTTPFQRIDYDYAMENYGCDKPDLRYDMKIMDVSNYFKETNFKVFSNALSNSKTIRAIIAKDFELTKNQVSNLEKFAIDNGAKGLAWVYFDGQSNKAGSVASVVESTIIKNIFNDYKISKGTILFVADQKETALSALGAVRIALAKLINIKFDKEFAFCWIVNWPLFEYSKEENRYVSAHHPFTSPTIETISTFDKDPKNAKAQSYDIVLNGYEIGGGSIRIYNRDVQSRIFNFLGLTPTEIQEKFGFLLNAFNYGVPPHGGIALGLDRFIMILTNSNNIREIIAFPKNSSGYDLMMDTPSDVDQKSLSELYIKKI